MFTAAAIREIQRLLDLGMSVRQVAARTGVGRGTVAAVRQGRRREQTKYAERALSKPGQVARAAAWTCPACGLRITLAECVRCRAEEARRTGRYERQVAKHGSHPPYVATADEIAAASEAIRRNWPPNDSRLSERQERYRIPVIPVGELWDADEALEMGLVAASCV